MKRLIPLAIALLAALPLAAQDQNATTVPFELKQHIILVKGTLCGQEGHIFIVDTGASVTCVTPAAAKKAGLQGNMMTRCPSISAGAAVAENIQVAIMDPPQAQPMRQMLGVDYSGILGYSYLRKFVTTFDYPRKQLTFVPRDKAPALEADGQSSWLLPFKTVQNIIIVEAHVNGQGPFTFIFDSGASETILTPPTAQRLGLKGEKVNSMMGLVEKARVETIKAADAEVKGIDIVVLDPPQAAPLRMLGVDYHGILGSSFFRRFLITLDYGAKKIRLSLHSGEPTIPTSSEKDQIMQKVRAQLEAHRARLLADIEKILDQALGIQAKPEPPPAPAPKKRPYLGIQPAELTDDEKTELKLPGGVRVVGVQTGAPADGKLQVDDIITQINGQAVSDIQALIEVLGKAGAGAEVTITARRGAQDQELKIKLAEFPNPND